MTPQRPSIIMSYILRQGNRSRVMPILDSRAMREPNSSPTVTLEGSSSISMHIIRAIAEHAAQAEQLLEAVTLSLESAAEEVQHDTVSNEKLDEIAPTMRYCKALNLNNAECAICLTKFRRNKHVKQMPCTHAFCSSCVSKWVCEVHACCPICREPIPAEMASSSS